MELTSRERVQLALRGEEPDRVPYQDIFSKSTIARWRQEGLPDVEPTDYFGCEITRLGADYSLQFPLRTIEETDRYRVYVDADGATRKEIAQGDDWTPHWLEFTVTDADSWARVRERLTYNESRIGPATDQIYANARSGPLCRLFRARILSSDVAQNRPGEHADCHVYRARLGRRHDGDPRPARVRSV